MKKMIKKQAQKDKDIVNTDDILKIVFISICQII
jgi:hypothetical protein